MSAHPDEFTGTEQAVLLVLMAQAEPVRNARLRDLGPELRKPQRDHLRGKGLIKVTPGPPMMIALEDDGWALCRKIIGSDPPDGVRGQNKTLYTLMKALGRYLDQAELAPSDVFGRISSGEPSGGDEDVEGRVRTAYRRLAATPGGWVGLGRVRAALTDVARADLDAALLRLHGAPDVSLIPEENQKSLTAADRAAAVRIGARDTHLIAIAR